MPAHVPRSLRRLEARFAGLEKKTAALLRAMGNADANGKVPPGFPAGRRRCMAAGRFAS